MVTEPPKDIIESNDSFDAKTAFLTAFIWEARLSVSLISIKERGSPNMCDNPSILSSLVAFSRDDILTSSGLLQFRFLSSSPIIEPACSSF
jgi:hypothetical protein